MTAPAVQTDPSQQPPDGLSDAEQAALAALTTFFAEAALVTSVAVPPYLYAQLLRLGFDKRAVRSAFRLAAGLPLGRRQGRSPQTKRRSARRPGTAAAQVAAEEPEWRARYLLAAARRITDRVQAGKTPAQAVRDEQPILDRHRDAGRRRAGAAANVDKTAEHAPGGLLVWKLDPTLNNTPGCVWANNRIFTRDAPLVFSDEPGLPAKPQWPGAVHPKCGCRAEPLGGYIDLDQLAASNPETARRLALGALEKKPGGPDNWIERLPAGMQAAFDRSIIYRAAVHMHQERGMPVGMAIASAINWCKHIAATGDVKQWPGTQHVRPTSVAECRAALALWESMKAAAHSGKGRSVKASNTGAPMTDRTSGEVSDFPKHSFIQFANEPLALASSWDGSKHPRGKKGDPNGGKSVAGNARDQNAAAAQKDGKAAGNYDAGMRDPKKVDEQLKGMSDADLQALTRYAYSFKSSDPKVVALRFKLAGALKSRGQDVNDYGGLGKSSGKNKPSAGRSAPAPAKSTRKQVVKKTTRTSTAAGLSHSTPAASKLHASVGAVALAQASAPASKQGRWTDEQRRQMASKKIALADGSFPIPDRAHLAKAKKAKGRAAPGKRPLVEAHIRRRARALGVNPDDC